MHEYANALLFVASQKQRIQKTTINSVCMLSSTLLLQKNVIFPDMGPLKFFCRSVFHHFTHYGQGVKKATLQEKEKKNILTF